LKKTATLILTGWDSDSHVYAHCAALALRAFPDADVRGVSKARLPETLEAAKGYARVLILGVSLGGNPQRLARGVRALTGQSVSLRWISALAPTASIDDATFKALSPFVQDVSLQEAVCACLGVEDGLADAVKANAPLLDAAGYAHRNLDDDSVFGAAVRHVARGEGPKDWSADEQTLIRSHGALSSAPLTGHSPAMSEIRRVIRQVARHADIRVLILGESGTGKEAAALMLHHLSSRRDNEFVPLNCAGSNLQLLEDAFRGHEKGAFTGAAARAAKAANGEWMSESSPPPTGISGGWCATVCSGRTCSTGSAQSRCGCPRCASTQKTYPRSLANCGSADDVTGGAR